MRVLAADDDPSLLLLIRVTLEQRGHHVITATNGADALEKCKVDRPDVILLDVMMPTLDGFETLKALKELDATSGIPVVLVSARVGRDDRRRGLEAGASDYLTKPFDPDALGRTVEDLYAMTPDGRNEQREQRLTAIAPEETAEAEARVERHADATERDQLTSVFSVLDLAVDAIVSVDNTQRIVSFNKGAETVFGYLAEEVLGKPLEVLLPKRFARMHSTHVERFAGGGEASRLMGERQEIFGRRKNGTEFPAEASIAKVDVGGRQILTAIMRDVTEQRRTEQELRKRANQQAAVAELGQLALTGGTDSLFEQGARTVADVLGVEYSGVMQLEGDEIVVSAAVGWTGGILGARAPRTASSMTGYTLQQAEPVVSLDLAAESRFVPHKSLFDHNAVCGLIVVIKGPESPFGVLSVFSTTPRTFGSDDVNFVQAIANTLAGAITRERSEERLRIFLESAPDATIVVNNDGRIVSANPQAENLFGYSRSELLELPVDALVPAHVHGAHAGYRKQFDREPRTRPMGAGLNLVALRKDGREVPVDILLRPLETDEGRLVVAAVRDVTERRRSEQVRDAFLHAVSHDLRTPLTAVVGFSALLTKPAIAASADTVVEYAGMISNSANKLQGLLSDLLDLDRLARGVIRPQRRETELASLVQSVASTVNLADGQLSVEIEPDTRIVCVDPAQLERIVENLLVNVTRHCPSGTPAWVKACRGPNGVLISVEDSGPGVPDDIKQELFEPFRRGDEGAASPGSGIGLSLVARFAELHGGRAWIDDRDGGGAAFRVLLSES